MSDELPSFTPEALEELYHALIAKSRSVGKDGVRHSVFLKRLPEECDLIARKVRDGTYKFTPYREKLIPRGPHRPPRQLSVPTVRDRLTLRAICNTIKVVIPAANVPAPHTYIRACSKAIADAREHSSFLRMDIKSYYPSIPHEPLLEKLAANGLPGEIVTAIRAAISTVTGDKKAPSTVTGVPQGLSISNALSAVYLADFDIEMNELGFYRRYVDDILFIAPTEKIKTIYKSAFSALEKRGLTSHPLVTKDKTEEFRLADGVQYLGYVLKPNLISIRKASFDRMFRNLFRILTNIKYKKISDRDIWKLNLKITGCIVNETRRGWLMFFGQTDNMKQLKHLDKFLDTQIKKLGHVRNDVGIKYFVKSFYEIKFNLSGSGYIPNFDTMSLSDRIDVICLLRVEQRAEWDTRSPEAIEAEFSRLISKEVSDLEKDVMEAFS